MNGARSARNTKAMAMAKDSASDTPASASSQRYEKIKHQQPEKTGSTYSKDVDKTASMLDVQSLAKTPSISTPDPVANIDPTLLIEINKLVDDAAQLKWIGDTEKSNTATTCATTTSLPAVESTVDEALIGTLEMIVSDAGEIEPATQSLDTIDVTRSLIVSGSESGQEHAAERISLSPSKRTPNNLVDRDRRWVVNASSLGNEASQEYSVRVARFLHELRVHKDRIAGLVINGVRFSTAIADKIVESIWENTGAVRHGKFPFLVDLDMAYIPIAERYFPTIGHILNPVKSGYCPLKRLVLTQCRLGIAGTRTVFNALCTNVFLEELIVNGNHCTDAVIPDIVRCLVSSSNRFKTLGLGTNDLTAAGMVGFAAALEGHASLCELQLNGNNIGDEGADHVFKALRDNDRLERLNLSYCGIQECQWSGRLRIMTSLGYLNLSQNEITDAGCSALCDALEACACLRQLDLSSNMFGDRLSVKLGTVLEKNKGLQNLNLSNNLMIPECWNAISVGLAANDTLMKLNVSMCDLTIKQAERLYEALAVNNIVQLKMDMNPIPWLLRNDARNYRRKGLVDALPVDLDAAGKSLIRGHEWRVVRLDDLITSKQSRAIITELKETAALQQAEAEQRQAAQLAAARRTKAGAGEDFEPTNNGTTADLSADAASGSASPQSLHNPSHANQVPASPAPKALSKRGEKAAAAIALADESSITSSVLISPGAKRKKDARTKQAALDAGAVNDNQGRLVLTVCYGRESEVLGTIDVQHGTTYPDTVALIRPLVKEYLKGLGQLEMAEMLTENFTVLDTNGLPVTGPQATVRTVWSEASLNHHQLIVRPANWIHLPENATSSAVDVAVIQKAALDTEKDMRMAATRHALQLDLEAEAVAGAVDMLRSPTKRDDPSFLAQPFVSFEYDDDAFGISAEADDVSILSAGSATSAYVDLELFPSNGERVDDLEKVKWV